MFSTLTPGSDVLGPLPSVMKDSSVGPKQSVFLVHPAAEDPTTDGTPMFPTREATSTLPSLATYTPGAVRTYFFFQVTFANSSSRLVFSSM